jgi:hypothetical protein
MRSSETKDDEAPSTRRSEISRQRVLVVGDDADRR